MCTLKRAYTYRHMNTCTYTRQTKRTPHRAVTSPLLDWHLIGYFPQVLTCMWDKVSLHCWLRQRRTDRSAWEILARLNTLEASHLSLWDIPQGDSSKHKTESTFQNTHSNNIYTAPNWKQPKFRSSDKLSPPYSRPGSRHRLESE